MGKPLRSLVIVVGVLAVVLSAKRSFIAPAIIMTTGLLSFAVIPFAPGIQVVDLNIGLLFFLGMSSMGVYSIMLAAWSSDDKYSLMGSLCGAARMLSYEGPATSPVPTYEARINDGTIEVRER